MDQIINDIQRSINSLNALELHGKQNFSLLLGAIYTLEDVKAALGKMNTSAELEVVPDAEDHPE